MKKFLILAVASGILFAGEGDIFRAKLSAEKFEISKDKSKSWDISLYGGYDVNKLYLYSQKEDSLYRTELLFSHAISPYWDIQVGVEIDKDSKSKKYGVIALRGLAPYYFETRAKLLIGNGVGVDAEFSYETLFTQKLILDSSFGFRAFSKSNVEVGNYKGLNNIELGARLRYEITKKFAPYIGVSWSKNFGDKKRVEGNTETKVVAGVRFWF